MDNLKNFSNPSPPPNIKILNTCIKGSYQIIDGVLCEFLGLIVESGILEDCCPLGDFQEDVSSDDEVVLLDVVRKLVPLVDIDEELNSDPPPDESSSQGTSDKHGSCCTEIGGEKSPLRDSCHHSEEIRPKRKRMESPLSLKNKDSRIYNGDKNASKKKLVSGVDLKPFSKQKSSLKQEPFVKQEPYSNMCRKLHCSVCKVSMSSLIAYQNHMNGKKHMKTLRLKDLVKPDDYTNPATFLNKYPLPPQNVYRKKIKEIAQSQKVIEKRVKNPCPGLEKVIEIQGLDDTRYYCELCESTCNSDSLIPHLSGFPHQLQSVKYFRPGIYENKLESYSIRQRRAVKGEVIRILKEIEKKRGCGKITVEKEFLKEEKEFLKEEKDRGYDSKIKKDRPGSSHLDLEDSFIESFASTIIPDSTKSDFYCRICDAHMSSKIVWESHIKGKRHIANAQKRPSEEASKNKTVLMPNARPLLLDELKYVEEPVVGLDHIRETRKPEITGALYNCYLCGACSGCPGDIIDHILSQKHRTKYLEKINNPDIMLLKQMDMQESCLASIIVDTCTQVEAERGRGNIEVYCTKKSTSTARW